MAGEGSDPRPKKPPAHAPAEHVQCTYIVHTYRGPWQCASSSCIERVICLNWRLPPYARLNTFLQFISPCMSSGVGAVQKSSRKIIYYIILMISPPVHRCTNICVQNWVYRGHHNKTPGLVPLNQNEIPRQVTLYQNEIPRHVPQCQKEIPRHVTLYQNEIPRQVPQCRNKRPRQVPS